MDKLLAERENIGQERLQGATYLLPEATRRVPVVLR